MSVRRIVANIAGQAPRELATFYRDLFDLEIVMDLDWIVTMQGGDMAPVQISLAREGGSGTEVPALSIEVDNLDDILARARRADLPIVYGPVTEPWGVRRFFLRDPVGTLLNVLSHVD